MTFFERITGRDMTKKYRELEHRLEQMPVEYQKTGKQIHGKLVLHSDFTGRNIMYISEGVLEFLEEMNEQGKTIEEIFGNDLDTFCNELTKNQPTFDVRDRWRRKLNTKIQKRFS